MNNGGDVAITQLLVGNNNSHNRVMTNDGRAVSGNNEGGIGDNDGNARVTMNDGGDIMNHSVVCW